MGYRTREDPQDTWHEYLATNVTRTMQCTISDKAVSPLNSRLTFKFKYWREFQILQREAKGSYDCDVLDLFEMSTNQYPFYLLNIRIPIDRVRIFELAQKIAKSESEKRFCAGSVHSRRHLSKLSDRHDTITQRHCGFSPLCQHLSDLESSNGVNCRLSTRTEASHSCGYG